MNEMHVKLEDYTDKVKAEMEKICLAWLHEAGGEVESQVKRNTPVDTSQLKQSWDYKVNEVDKEAVIGSPLEQAIWNEFGTGHYALNGDGRKTPWYVPVEGYLGKKKPTFNGKVVIVVGKNGKQFYKTNGKRPQRSLFTAYESKKTALKKGLQSKLKGAMK